MSLHIKLLHFLMRSIKIRRISRHPASANLIIAAFVYIEVNRPVSGGELITGTIAPGRVVADPAGTVPVNLAFLQIEIIWEVSRI